MMTCKTSLFLVVFVALGCGGDLSPTSPFAPQVASVAARSFQLINAERTLEGVEPALAQQNALSSVAAAP